MSGKEFMSKCTACGGNWCAMLMSGIRTCFPDRYAKMEDKEYGFQELYDIAKEEGVEW